MLTDNQYAKTVTLNYEEIESHPEFQILKCL